MSFSLHHKGQNRQCKNNLINFVAYSWAKHKILSCH